MRTFLVSLLSILSLIIPISLFAQPDISVFTSPAVLNEVAISPEGTYIAFTGNEDGIDFISVIRTDDRSTVLDKRGFGESFTIASFTWATEERLIIIASPALFGGGPGSNGQIFAMDANGENFEIIMGANRSGGTSRIRANDRPQSGMIVDMLPDDPDQILVTDTPFGFGPRPPKNTAYYADINTGRLREVIASPVANGRFITNHDGEIAYTIGLQSRIDSIAGSINNLSVYSISLGGVQEVYRLTSDDEWVRMSTSEDTNWFTPVTSLSANRMLVSTVGENGTTGYSVWNIESNSVSPVFHHDIVDVKGLLYDRDGGVWGIEFHDHYPEYVYLNQEHPYAKLHMSLRQTLSAFDVKVVDATADFSKAVIHISSPQNPGEYLLLDTEQMQYLMRMASYTDFPNDQMGRMDPFELTARDGSMLPGYLTLPASAEESDLPMVVIPHDGPHNIYDTWSYNPLVQLYASHGYAVLQINYRGSGGRGMNFKALGYGEWGGLMHNDLIDAVNWAIDSDIADKDRICIQGNGYGAYAAVTASFKEPELFQCVIGVSGIYDLENFYERTTATENERPITDPGIYNLLEAIEGNAGFFEENSPVVNAGNISADVMLVHDYVNLFMPIIGAENLRDALISVGNEPVWVVPESRSVFVMSPENITNVYEQMLEFVEGSIGN